ncbi:transcriptional regulator, ArsR family [Roseiflexus castenholzii DSM 13941]|uniref:Transcriptional regulator, ArsR family n=1 Tax=Roseiflexus castenholzii (strain DSM 13941 / HLO8) TaxID=383372 RepID=A7NLQ8_ROSCS|nr:transcriptional regulator, ArsR family [Roseiflexus castenholzii DSM 13941]
MESEHVNDPVRRFKAEFFKALGHPARLALLDHLRNGEKSVNELQALLRCDQSTVSQQLSVLRNRGIVEGRKEGTTVCYRVRDPAIFRLLDDAREIFNNQLITTQEMLQQLSEVNTT